jgi:hypothetical protein
MKIGFGGEMGRRVTQAGAAAALSLFLGAGVASASPDTLRMALEDILFGAVDVVVAPVNGGRATARNFDEVSDNAVLQGLYAVPAALGLTTLQALQGALRTATGIVELVPGIFLFPFSADLDPDLNVFRRGDLMVDLENPLGDEPPWLAYVPIATPFTIDVRIGPLSPWALYRAPHGEE